MLKPEVNSIVFVTKNFALSRSYYYGLQINGVSINLPVLSVHGMKLKSSTAISSFVGSLERGRAIILMRNGLLELIVMSPIKHTARHSNQQQFDGMPTPHAPCVKLLTKACTVIGYSQYTRSKDFE